MNIKSLWLIHLCVLVSLALMTTGLFLIEYSTKTEITQRSHIGIKLFVLCLATLLYAFFLWLWLPEYEGAVKQERRDSEE